MGTPLNHQTLLEIDTNYGGTAAWATIAAGITDIDTAMNEAVAQNKYMDGGGYAESDVTGGQLTVSLPGHRVYGDIAQDFIFGKMMSFGDNRKTQARLTDPDGARKTGSCTLAGIAPPSGAAGDKQAITIDVHFNGKPVESPAASAPALTATVGAGSVLGSTEFTATATAGNTLGYTLSNGAIDTPNALSFAEVIAYTSAGNIAAVVDQYLNMYEIDADNRVVKFLSEKLATADINPGT